MYVLFQTAGFSDNGAFTVFNIIQNVLDVASIV